ncbi:MAG TPA: RNA polymerase sigma factor [Solirubrobacteraceae bacterium]
MSLSGEDVLALYDRYARELLGFFARRTSDPQLALDLLGETFLAVFAARKRCDAEQDAQQAAWLYAIASNKLAEHRRRSARELRALQRLGGELTRPLSDFEYERVEQLATEDALHKRLAKVLPALSEEQEQAIALRVVGERSYAEVAGEMGVSEQAARARVSRGLKVLRNAIGPARRDPT